MRNFDFFNSKFWLTIGCSSFLFSIFASVAAKVPVLFSSSTLISSSLILSAGLGGAETFPSTSTSPSDEKILTPRAPREPRINGAGIFGVRPGHPFFFTIAATGNRPMTFSVVGMPEGLRLDASNGQITGTIAAPGELTCSLHAKNAFGETQRKLRIVIGEKIALTPPMGWNSWNCWGEKIDQEKIMRAANAMATSGLIDHGWTYVNIDDTWQGTRGGEFNAIQASESFPDIGALCGQIHKLGLKAGIYSTPWVTSYAGHVGGSSEDQAGAWDRTMTKGPMNNKVLPHAIGKFRFFSQDARQYAAWGFDYLKFDWAPNELKETSDEYGSLRNSGRDIVLSLSNNTTRSLFPIISDMSKVANCWRISGDIFDTWSSVVSHGFGQDQWAPFAGPGHWNDPDMFEIGANGGGKAKRLTADEQYTHVSLWCLLAAPLLLGCDMDHLTPFTLNLLTNDEVLAVDQDSLGIQATTVGQDGNLPVLAKRLEDEALAVGLFNLEPTEQSCSAKWADLKINGEYRVRDLWRQKDLGVFSNSFSATVPSHGVLLIKLSPAS